MGFFLFLFLSLALPLPLSPTLFLSLSPSLSLTLSTPLITTLLIDWLEAVDYHGPLVTRYLMMRGERRGEGAREDGEEVEEKKK